MDLHRIIKIIQSILKYTPIVRKLCLKEDKIVMNVAYVMRTKNPNAIVYVSVLAFLLMIIGTLTMKICQLILKKEVLRYYIEIE